MKEKIKTRGGFIQIPLLIGVIVSIIVITGIGYRTFERHKISNVETTTVTTVIIEQSITTTTTVTTVPPTTAITTRPSATTTTRKPTTTTTTVTTVPRTTTITTRPSTTTTTIKRTTQYEPIIFALNKSFADKFPDWKEKADIVIDNVNFVFAKNTNIAFTMSKYLTYNDSDYTNLFTYPDKYSEYYQDVGSRGGITYILLITKDGISNQELKQLYGSDTVNQLLTIHKDGKRYPIILQANPESTNIFLDEFRFIQILLPVHEIGHALGLGTPEWYLYEYSDCTGINPKFSDYSIKEDPNFLNDPMVMMVMSQKHSEDMQFNELSTAIINKNLDFKYTSGDIESNWFSRNTKVYVTDKDGAPIPNATVKIFCVLKGCVFCSTECRGVIYGHGVPSNSPPEQTLLTDKNGYAIYNGPVGAGEMFETQNSPCVAKAIKVYYNGKSNVKVINFIDLQKNYILNNSNEHITHIVLE